MFLAKRKIIIIHSRKCGGSYIKEIFLNAGEFLQTSDKNLFDWGVIEISKKNYYPDYKENFANPIIQKEKQKDCQIYLPVRNPFERAVSGYLFLQSLERFKHNFAKKYNFNDFLKFLDNEEGHLIFRSHSLMSYLDHITLPSGEELPHQIIRFENLQNNLDSICLKNNIKISQNIGLVNANSFRYNYKNFYNKESIDIVERIYSKDLERFGYTW